MHLLMQRQSRLRKENPSRALKLLLSKFQYHKVDLLLFLDRS